MKNTLFIFLICFSPMTLLAQDFTGDWQGTLQIQGNELPIVFHITEAEGQLTATMDSPKQGAYGIATDTCFVEAGQLTIKAQAMMLTFTATLQDGTLDGIFAQGMAQLSLKMNKVDASQTSVDRPQDPQPPYPYLSEEITFPNPAAGITLAGTLTRPKNAAAPTIVIMISGSGPQDRNSEIMNHRPFLVWADHLTRLGIAVLRFDERGVGESEGDYASATSEDFASDVAAAVDFVQQHEVFQNSKVGLIGHSEGGLVAPMVAVKEAKEIDFMVLLAAPGVPITELMLEQYTQVINGQGIQEPTKSMIIDQQKEIYDLVATTGDLPTETIRDTIFDFYEQKNGGVNLRNNPQVKNAVNQFSSPWMRFFLAYDPVPALEQIKIPVLAINGDKDTQVIAGQNLPGIEAALQKAGNDQVRTKVFSGLNHLFQTAETGQATEYAQIEETVNPEVLKFVGDWILQLP